MDPALAKEIAIVAKYNSIAEKISEGSSKIQAFYKDAVVFVTGGSGFLGKQLIEKLLRSCEIKKIYMLLRPKKNKNVTERLSILLKEPVFESLAKVNPNFAEKLKPVEGDISKIGIGISEEDWKAITTEVDIIIHGAATVNFDEPIKVATLINVRGTREMLLLGKQCQKLRSYIHLSTAFSHATRSRINKDLLEQFYSAPIPPDVMIDIVENVDENVLNDITPRLIQDWPNTYTFTKAIGEEAVRKMAGEMPICIVRPAIVVASQFEPSPGWLDISCANGPSGLILGIGLGIIHITFASDEARIDLVPVDVVNNAIIAAGAKTPQLRVSGDKDPKIYTVSSIRNSITMGGIQKYLKDGSLLSPRLVWYMTYVVTSNSLVYNTLSILWHHIPASIVDAVCWTLGKPQKFRKLYQKADKLCKVLSYFTCNEWISSDRNLQELYKDMTPEDQLIYNFSIKDIDWPEYMQIWSIGIRKYIVQDGLRGTDYAQKKQFWLRILHYIVLAIYFYVLWMMVSMTFSAVTFCFSFLTDK